MAEQAYQRYMHASPLPVQGLPGEERLGGTFWVALEARRTEDAPR